MTVIKIDKTVKLEDIESCYNELYGYMALPRQCWCCNLHHPLQSPLQ